MRWRGKRSERPQSQPGVTRQRASVVGVYEVAAREPCHLVEVLLRDLDAAVDVAAFTQPIPGSPRDSWQVPYDEWLLDAGGTCVLGQPSADNGGEAMWRGTARLVFFFHYLDLNQPLESPFGPLELPTPTSRPGRLNDLHYEPPC